MLCGLMAKPEPPQGISPSAGLFLPLSELKAVRRAAAEAFLGSLHRRPSTENLSAGPVLPALLARAAAKSGAVLRSGGGPAEEPPGRGEHPRRGAPLLRVLCRSMAQVCSPF